MSLNIRSSLAEFPKSVDPNFKGVTSSVQKIYPVTNIINAGAISGNLEFQFTVPQGYRADVSKTYIVFDVSFSDAADGATNPTKSFVAPNVCSTFFSSGRVDFNDFLTASSSNMPQDDTFMKRMLNSETKNYSINGAFWADSDTNRFAENGVVKAAVPILQRKLHWLPHCLFNPETVLPENTRVHLTLMVHPNINTPASCPCFVSQDDATANLALPKFYGIYMTTHFIKLDLPTPTQVFIPTYNVRSTIVNLPPAPDHQLQVTVPPTTYKIGIALQGQGTTTATGMALTRFHSPTAAKAKGEMSLESALLQNLQIRYGGNTYPSSQYALATNGDIDAYTDFLSATDAQLDPSGGEKYRSMWVDPILPGSTGQGRIFAFSIIKPQGDMDSNMEVTLKFSGNPATTRCLIFAISKQAVGIQYNSQKSIESVSIVPY